MRQGTPDETQGLTQVEFSEADHVAAEAIARAMGYEQYAYTSTSALWGLFCLPENPATAKPHEPTHGACIIKTRELGFLVVQNCEDIGLTDDGTPRRADAWRQLRGRR